VPRTKFETVEDAWRAYLSGTHPNLFLGHRTFGLLPSNPRCKLCSAPFRGPGGFLLRRISDGFEPWEKFPKVCKRCLRGLNTLDVSGAEVETSFLFADVRASSDLARRLGTMDFTHLMQRFYAVATGILFDHDALLDKFVGDEVVGFFLPVMAGPRHANRAVEAAKALFAAAGYGTTEGPWIPLGAGVHTGPSFVGFVSRGTQSEFTALGDTINVAAHLAAEAGAGEILITDAVGASLETDGLERRPLSLKGHDVDALVITVGERGTAEAGVA